MTPLAFVPSITARVERLSASGGLSFGAVGSEFWAMSTPRSFSAPQFVSRGRGATPNQALQRTRRERRGCSRGVPCAGSLSLGR